MKDLLINEGQVKIKVPHFEKVSSQATVFYNPAMELNRDLSVLTLKQYQKDLGAELSILDAFGGTGIRGIRYAKEIKHVQRVVINDINPKATVLAELNAKENGLNNIKVCKNEANKLLRNCGGKFNVVDIDPFGTPSPFIESAAYNLPESSLLSVTATDTSALCGTYQNPCIRKYGSKPLKTEYCHETGLRILAGYLALTFAHYKKFLIFKFSHSTQHYMRINALVGKGAKNTDISLKEIGYIAHCPHCLHRDIIIGLASSINTKCPHCANKVVIGGPLWCGNLQDSKFTEGMLEKSQDIVLNKEKSAVKLLEIVIKESNAPATFYDVHKLSGKLKISAPPMADIFKSLDDEGYLATPTHFKPTGIKTDAPLSVLNKILCDLKR
jgi:tRNA (guanine26-N2/guanine27-N2)-dimethyltransferase